MKCCMLYEVWYAVWSAVCCMKCSCVVWRAVCCMRCGMLYEVQYAVWSAVCCMKCGMLYEVRYAVWSAVCCMRCGMLYEVRYAVWSAACCMKRGMLYEVQYAVWSAVCCMKCCCVVWHALCCMKCGMLYEVQYAVWGAVCCMRCGMLCQSHSIFIVFDVFLDSFYFYTFLCHIICYNFCMWVQVSCSTISFTGTYIWNLITLVLMIQHVKCWISFCAVSIDRSHYEWLMQLVTLNCVSTFLLVWC